MLISIETLGISFWILLLGTLTLLLIYNIILKKRKSK